jgi:hypothetical protein
MITRDSLVCLPAELDPDPYVAAFLRLATEKGCRRWTDLGCGGGGQAVRVAGAGPALRVAVDAVAPTVAVGGWNFIESDIREHVLSCDTDREAIASMFDVIEHFDQAAGDELLKAVCERFAGQIVFTPVGFLRQDPQTRPDLADQPWMWHRSGWHPSYFAERGFVVLQLPLAHARRGAFLAVRLWQWSDSDREQFIAGIRRIYLRRVLNPHQVFRRLRSAAAYWFGDSRLYVACRRALRVR